MNTAFAIPAFGPVLPEIILAAGVLALVLFGAIRGERSAGTVNILSLVLLGAALIAVLMLPSGTGRDDGGSFIIDSFAKFMKSLTLIASAGGDHPVNRLHAPRAHQPVRISRSSSCSRPSA